LAIAYSTAEGDVFRKVKGILDYLFSSLNLEMIYKKCESRPGWSEENICADIIVGGKNIGTVAKLSLACANKINIKKPAAIAEINFKELYNFYRAAGIKKYKAMEKYPPVVRDLAFVIEDNIMYNDVRKEIINFIRVIKEVELFDVYEGGKLGVDKKSLAFHIVYQTDRTLTSEEVDKLQGELIKNLEKKFGAKIRNF
jgi:phenylalanyl-tRNA synthetase beta chain